MGELSGRRTGQRATIGRSQAGRQRTVDPTPAIPSSPRGQRVGGEGVDDRLMGVDGEDEEERGASSSGWQGSRLSSRWSD